MPDLNEPPRVAAPPECVCGHAVELHEHYSKRSSSYCARCNCASYRTADRTPFWMDSSWWRVLKAKLSRK